MAELSKADQYRVNKRADWQAKTILVARYRAEYLAAYANLKKIIEEEVRDGD